MHNYSEGDHWWCQSIIENYIYQCMWVQTSNLKGGLGNNYVACIMVMRKWQPL
jgi:hypothetical protein